MNNFFYEIKPSAITLVGLWALATSLSATSYGKTLAISGAMLAFSGIYLLKLRSRYRKGRRFA